MFIKSILEDVKVIKEKDPAARSSIEVLLLYSGLHAVIYHRIAHFFYNRKFYFIARFVSQTSRFLTGIAIHPGAKIGKGLFIDHGSGVIIGETTEIGDYCTLYQGVTLGGTGKHKGKRHPTLGNNVLVGSGAKILGPFTVGDHAKIAANAVVLTEIPPNSTAVGIPARIVSQKPSADNLDHVHTPDPLSQQLCQLSYKIDQLEKTIKELQNTKDEAL
jgi:serine O-acetyltransferase